MFIINTAPKKNQRTYIIFYIIIVLLVGNPFTLTGSDVLLFDVFAFNIKSCFRCHVATLITFGFSSALCVILIVSFGIFKSLSRLFTHSFYTFHRVQLITGSFLEPNGPARAMKRRDGRHGEQHDKADIEPSTVEPG